MKSKALTATSNHERLPYKRTSRGASEIAQFIPALYILFVIFLLPLLNLVTVMVAAATQYLATNDFAAKAATQPDFSSALNAMALEASQFQSYGFSRFLKMVPAGGFIGCGDDLYIVATNLGNGAIVKSQANQPLNQPIDTQKSMYELSVTSLYTMSPLISLACVPVLGSVPGLGAPVTLTFTAQRPVEHPGGLQQPANPSGGSSPPLLGRIGASASGSQPPPTGDTWRTPDIFTKIKNAGQTVVSITVLTIPAYVGPGTGGWTPTGVTVSPGQSVWLDTQAVGVWGAQVPPVDANGLPNSYLGAGNPMSIDMDLPNQMLIGYVGNPPVLPIGFDGGIMGDPRFIPSGNTLLNYPINFSGPISMACNDNQTGESGVQTVRIIVTR